MVRDRGEETSSLDRGQVNRKQCNLRTFVYDENPGSSVDKQDKRSYSSQDGYDNARRPLRAGAEGSHSFCADDRTGLPLRAGGENKLSVGSGNDNQHMWEGNHSSQAGYDSKRHVPPVDDMTMVHKPMDPDLVCPICGKIFRIREIQKFRKHVDECV